MIEADWPAPPRVRALVTTRDFGDLADEGVRRKLRGLLPAEPSWLKQVHGTRVIDLDRPIQRHGTPPALLECEFEAVGYRQVSRRQMEGGVGYLAIFEAPRARPEPAAIRPCRAPR